MAAVDYLHSLEIPILSALRDWQEQEMKKVSSELFASELRKDENRVDSNWGAKSDREKMKVVGTFAAGLAQRFGTTVQATSDLALYDTKFLPEGASKSDIGAAIRIFYGCLQRGHIPFEMEIPKDVDAYKNALGHAYMHLAQFQSQIGDEPLRTVPDLELLTSASPMELAEKWGSMGKKRGGDLNRRSKHNEAEREKRQEVVGSTGFGVSESTAIRWFENRFFESGVASHAA